MWLSMLVVEGERGGSDRSSSSSSPEQLTMGHFWGGTDDLKPDSHCRRAAVKGGGACFGGGEGDSREMSRGHRNRGSELRALKVSGDELHRLNLTGSHARILGNVVPN